MPYTVGNPTSLPASDPETRAHLEWLGFIQPNGLVVSAPRGEGSGSMDFRVADMTRTAGRPLCSALRLLLSEQRLLALPRNQRLAALLEDSRKYKNEVSERLYEQVLHALYELVRRLTPSSPSFLHGSYLRRLPNASR